MRRLMICCSLLCGTLAACVSDRPRPDPTTVNDPESFELASSLSKPANNATVLGTKPIDISVFGAEFNHDALTGLGYVVRRNGVRIDSVAVHFTERRDSTVTFSYTVPDFPTNTHLSIFGLAYGPSGAFAVSEATLVTVVRCAPQIEGC